MSTKTVQAQAQSQSHSMQPSPVPPQARLPTTSPQQQSIPTPSPSQQPTSSPQALETIPSTPPPAPVTPTQKATTIFATWTTVALGLATLMTAIYYGPLMLSYAEWTKHNDFREGCINDREHSLQMSVEYSEELLRSRVSFVKRQVEAVHGVCRPWGPFDDSSLRVCPRVCPRVRDAVCSLRRVSDGHLEVYIGEDDEVRLLFDSCSC